MVAAERAAKERAIAASGETAWVWRAEDAIPPLPAPAKASCGMTHLAAAEAERL
jgi:hypothetical protein